ncbi:AAA family ATPase [Paenibacillus profundus]|uniref:AAA family ATPase n=1 Tax=Paenibacillus profundus TaxID=1173085 RepID=A0ABS8YGX3_9BACL|nr:AAA family ATPase [Paenibacillus profundus]MCE5170986.1 AAA family ATPase [Paenibacillus profundus]
MKIIKLHLIGFGEMKDAVFTLADASTSQAVTLIAGPNEAGKSTITAFIRGMLYGFPKRRSGSARYEPAHGGAYGGRMIVQDAEGSEWTIERLERNGSMQTAIHKRDANGQVQLMNQHQLEAELAGGLNGDLFCRLFAITLDELHELQTLQGEDVGAFLYDTGLNGGRGVADAERWLQQELEQLYKPRGRTQEIVHTLQAIEQAERSRRAGMKHAARVDELVQQLEAAGVELEASVHERGQLRERLALTERAASVSGTWLRYVAAKQELEGLPDVSAWPPDGGARWQAAELRLAEAELARKRAEEKLRLMEQRLAAKRPHTALLQLAPEARRLAQLADTVQHWRESVSEAEAEASLAEAELWRLARQSDPAWTPEQLLACGASSALVERVQAELATADALRIAKAQAEDAAARAAREAAAAEAERQEAHTALERCEAAGVNGTGFAPPAARVEEIKRREQALQDALHAWRSSEASRGKANVAADSAPLPSQRHSRTRSSRIGGKSGAAYLFGVLALAAAIGLGALAGQWLAAGAVAFVGIAGVAAMAYLSSGRSSADGRNNEQVTVADYYAADGAEHQASVQVESLTELMQPLMPASTLHMGSGRMASRAGHSREGRGSVHVGQSLRGQSGLEAKLPALRAALAALDEWAHERSLLLERMRLTTEALAVAERRARTAALEAEAAAEKEAERVAGWQAWLYMSGLPAGLSPAGVLEHFRRAEQAAEMKRQSDRLYARHERLCGQIESFEQDCRRLFQQAQQMAAVNSVNIGKTETEEDPRGKTTVLNPEVAAAAEQESFDNESEPATAMVSPPPALSGSLNTDSDNPMFMGSVLGGLYRLVERIEQEENMLREYDHLEQQRVTLLEERDEKAVELEHVDQAKQKLLEEAQVRDDGQFKQRTADFERKIELEQRIREMDAILYRGGERSSFAAMDELLKQYDTRELEQRCSEQQLQVDELDRRIREGEERRGRLRQEYERLKTEVEGAAYRQEAAVHEAKLDEQASRYAVLSLAKTLIQRTRHLYEEEKQPLVLQRAGFYMERLTAGRYARVVAPLGTKRIALERKDGELVWSSELSRGTAEQLYLAMRCALAEAMSHKVAIPLILDDILVNFDRERLRSAVQALAALSVTHQVIMTTCHPHIADIFREAIPDVKLVELERRSL